MRAASSPRRRLESHRRLWASLVTLLGGVVVLSTIATVLRVSVMEDVRLGQDALHHHFAMASIPKNTRHRPGRALSLQACPEASRYFALGSLEDAIDANIDFHVLGGNLKSVQRLKDRSIDSTVDKLGIEFLPDGATTPTKQVTKHLRDHFEQHYDSRGGYGKPLPGRYTKDSPLIFEGRYVEVTEPTSGRDRWDAALGPIGPNCTKLIQLGRPGKDGTKYLCADPKQNTHKEKCHVVSIGGNDNWKFELQVVEQMGCETHTFDCTLNGGTPKKKPDRDDIHFYNYCIDASSRTDTHGRQYLTYLDILKTAGLTRAPILFKIDVEGFEFDIFAQMIRSSETRPYLPLQISVELHWATRMTGVEWMLRTRTSGELALLSNMMFSGGGYIPVHQFFSPYCTSCMEVLYFRGVC